MSKRRKILVGLLVIILLLAGILFWLTRGDQASVPFDDVTGTDPVLEAPNKESIPTIGIAEPVGWKADEVPLAAEGLAVTRFADGLDHPRTMYALPNGDILVSLTRSPPSEGGGLTAWIADKLMSRAGATGESANKVVLLRDRDGDGAAEDPIVIADNLSSPSGISWVDGTLFIANHDSLVAFDYALGDDRVSSEPRKLLDLPGGGGHWMRNLEPSLDGKHLYIAIGSVSNVGEQGMEAEDGRAAIWEYNIERGTARIFGDGLRNPNGLDWNPWSGELWTTVNERDMLGSDLVPDYLTNVPLGAQYGWPWFYWGDNVDDRVEAPMPQFLVEYTRRPEYALGPHVAALGLVFSKEGSRMGGRFDQGAFIARHGSWNRHPASGYDVVYVAFDERGNPQGKPVSVLGGFLTGEGTTRGRPTWVEWASDGSLLVSDDTAGIIWRVVAPGAEAQSAIERNRGDRLPPQRELIANPADAFRDGGPQ